MRIIITVLGADRPGIVALVSNCLYENNVNILDIHQTVMADGVFTMSMLADCGKMNSSFADFRAAIDAVSEKLGMEIRVQREELFTSMHRI